MSDKVENGLIESLLKEQFGDAIRSVEESYGMLDIVVKREKIIEIITWLRDSSLLSFNFLTSLCGMHFPDNKGEELGVVYHMHSFANNKRKHHGKRVWSIRKKQRQLPQIFAHYRFFYTKSQRSKTLERF